jgi:hypothetical protein
MSGRYHISTIRIHYRVPPASDMQLNRVGGYMSFTLRAPHALFDVLVLLRHLRRLVGEWLECLAEVDLV